MFWECLSLRPSPSVLRRLSARASGLLGCVLRPCWRFAISMPTTPRIDFERSSWGAWRALGSVCSWAFGMV
eukprot:7614878-Pyramimonas_sp.AAC.1